MDDYIKGLTYAEDTPNLQSISEAYHRDTNDNSSTWDVMGDNFDQVRCQWPGKSRNQRKNAEDAKPWRGASDVEVPVIEPRKDRLVALMMNAVHQGNWNALPVSSDDTENAASQGDFLRWMMDCWIPDAYEELELSAHNFVEKGVAATFCGWKKERRTQIERFDLEEIALDGPDGIVLAEFLSDEANEEAIILQLQNEFDFVDETIAKKALKQLREEGFADLPVAKGDIDHPIIQGKDPGADIILPPYAMSCKDLNRFHVRHFLTSAEILANVQSQDWNEDWAEDMVENHMGVTQREIDGDYSDRNSYASNRRAHSLDINSKDAPDLAEVVESYIKLVDEDSGAVGIYRCIWSPKQVATKRFEQYYAVYDLMNGLSEFPLSLTPYMRDTKRIYDVRALPERLRGNQRMSKVARDTTIDQFSLAVNPPRTHPSGRPPPVWGSGAKYPVRRGEENSYQTLDIPNTRREGVDLERFLNEEADYITGLNDGDPSSLALQQHFINRWLLHVSEVGRLCYKNFQKLYDGEDIFFRVTNSANAQTISKSTSQDELDFKIVFDTRLSNPDYVQQTIQALVQLKAGNTDGSYNNREIDSITAYLLVPQFASRFVRNPGEVESEILKGVSEDLAAIWSGQQVGARDEGAAIALEYINTSYLPKQSTQTRLQVDPEYAQNMELYIGQYQMQIEQQKNVVRGRLGTEAAELQGVNQ